MKKIDILSSYNGSGFLSLQKAIEEDILATKAIVEAFKKLI